MAPNTRLEEFKGKQVLVVGLARTGLATVRFLSKEGFFVVGNDIRPADSLSKTLQECTSLGVRVVLGDHPLSLFRESALIVVSPGVPLSIPPLEEARKRGREIISEIELASWVCPSRIVAVTGTNGKSTTVCLIGEILKQGKRRVAVAGNIGFPLISSMDMDPLPEVIVCELSSFQLEGIETFRPATGILLNLSPDHMDRYPSFDAYCGAKARLFRAQERNDWAILNADDPSTKKVLSLVRSRIAYFSRKQHVMPGAFCRHDIVSYSLPKGVSGTLSLEGIRIRGVHNQENLMASILAAKIEGITDETIQETVVQFRGLEHRMELVGEIKGVRFYNDSKATNVGAVEKALESFPSSVILLLGGRDKGLDFTPLGSLVHERVKTLICFGEARHKISKALSEEVECIVQETMQEAVHKAWEGAERGDTVLLSPGCTSFDQFTDFEHRGRVFKSVVGGLIHSCAEGQRACGGKG